MTVVRVLKAGAAINVIKFMGTPICVPPKNPLPEGVVKVVTAIFNRLGNQGFSEGCIKPEC